MDEDALLSVNQVAIVLKVHPLTIRRYIREGKLEAVKMAGNVRVAKSSIDKLSRDVKASQPNIKRPLITPTKHFTLDDPIFRIKGRGMSLKPV